MNNNRNLSEFKDGQDKIRNVNLNAKFAATKITAVMQQELLQKVTS